MGLFSKTTLYLRPFKIFTTTIHFVKPLQLHLEALIFAAEQPVSEKELRECLEEVFEASIDKDEFNLVLREVVERYKSEDYAFEVVEHSGGFQFLTKSSHHRVLTALLKQKTKKRLSQAALETLAIIAYRQPVTKTEAEKIRGVNCDYAVQKLLEKELIAISGRSEGPGKPLLYSTSAKFMDYLGIKSLEELPKLKDFPQAESEIGSEV